jgi:hypothetical protein
VRPSHKNIIDLTIRLRLNSQAGFCGGQTDAENKLGRVARLQVAGLFRDIIEGSIFRASSAAEQPGAPAPEPWSARHAAGWAVLLGRRRRTPAANDQFSGQRLFGVTIFRLLLRPPLIGMRFDRGCGSPATVRPDGRFRRSPWLFLDHPCCRDHAGLIIRGRSQSIPCDRRSRYRCIAAGSRRAATGESDGREKEGNPFRSHRGVLRHGQADAAGPDGGDNGPSRACGPEKQDATLLPNAGAINSGPLARSDSGPQEAAPGVLFAPVRPRKHVDRGRPSRLRRPAPGHLWH